MPTKPIDKACRRGHPRTMMSTYVRANGDRQCRICNSMMQKKRKEKRKANEQAREG
jgi:hypothetical protein